MLNHVFFGLHFDSVPQIFPPKNHNYTQTLQQGPDCPYWSVCVLSGPMAISRVSLDLLKLGIGDLFLVLDA